MEGRWRPDSLNGSGTKCPRCAEKMKWCHRCFNPFSSLIDAGMVPQNEMETLVLKIPFRIIKLLLNKIVKPLN